MGNKSSSDKSVEGKEMSSPEAFTAKSDHQETLPDLKELASMCSNLQDTVDDLAEAIDDIFEEGDEQNESTSVMESRLQEMTRNIQLKIQQLHRHLERHSKLVGVKNNDQVMALVRELVSIVNNYMNMLMRNIRRLRGMLMEMNLTQNIVASKQKRMSTQHDIIPEQLDVDSMLIQLSETEPKREELESDIMCVLVFWKDFKEIVPDDENELEKIEEKVKAAADSVAQGLTQLHSTKS